MGFDAQEEGRFEEEAEGDENGEGKTLLSGPILIHCFILDWSEIC